MQLADLVITSEKLAATRSRNAKIELLASMLSTLQVDEVGVAVSYLTGAIPQGRIGLGYSSSRQLFEAAVASAASLTLLDVDRTFEALSKLAGAGSAIERKRLFGELMQRATASEQIFLRKLIVAELRQGAVEGVMLEAIAKAAKVSSASVRRAAMLSGSIAEAARRALAGGERALSEVKLELMRPLSPMLAGTAADVDEALGELGEAAFELKFDGARIQVHCLGDEVRVFSREGNDVTQAVPEVVEGALALPSRSLVLDGEAIALGPSGAPLPFQATMSRFGRKKNLDSEPNSLRLSSFFFDVLHADGQDAIERPFSERAKLLDALVTPSQRTERLITASIEEAERFYDSAMSRGHEGLLVKSLSAPYEAGRRGSGWLKLKPAHTLDLIVLAVEWGSGRREGFLSNLHLGARDAEGTVMLGKTFKGMTDAMLKWQTDWFLRHELSRDAYTVYVEPKLVVEIAFDSVLASTQYPSGMALRFARVKRYREDKRADEADTIDTVRSIFSGRVAKGRPRT